MKNRAFTLIELLVVVLILGILVAIAVPQYQKAVKRSQAVEAILNMKSLLNAQRVFYLVNGHYTKNLNDLDVNLNSENYNYSFVVDKEKDIVYSYARPIGNNKYYFQMTPDGKTYCRGTKESCSFISTKKGYASLDDYWDIDISSI